MGCIGMQGMSISKTFKDWALIACLLVNSEWKYGGCAIPFFSPLHKVLLIPMNSYPLTWKLFWMHYCSFKQEWMLILDPVNMSWARYWLLNLSHTWIEEDCETAPSRSFRQVEQCYIKWGTLLSRNYNFSIDINVDSTVSKDSGIRPDYDSQRTVLRVMI